MADRRTEAPQPAEVKLPCDPAVERLVLGAVLSGTPFATASELLQADDFSLEIHRRVFLRMADLHKRAAPIDYAAVANELRLHGQLESIAQGTVGPLEYLVSLSRDAPALPNLESHCRILKDRSLERQLFQVNRRYAKGVLSGTLDVKQALDSLAAEVQRLQDAAYVGSGERPGKNPREIIEGFTGGIEAFLNPELRPRGLMSGLHKLDEMMGGFRGGQIITIAGRTSAGKSALALNIVEKLAVREEDPVACGYFTFEMPGSAMVNRLISSRARVDDFRIRNNYINAAERRRMQEALAEIVEAPIYMLEQEYHKINDVCAQLRQLVRKSEVRLAVVDHLGLVRSDMRFDNKAQELDMFMQRLKLTAMDLDIPILVLCQLKRPPNQTAGKPPELEDLKDSSGIEQNSDAVLMIWREWLLKSDREDNKEKGTIFIRKQREGSIGAVKVKFLSGFTRFENADDQMNTEETS